MNQYLNKEFLLSNKEKIIKVAAIIVLMVAAFFTLIIGGEKNEKESLITGDSEKEVVEETEQIINDMIIVDVTGAVNEPQVVELPAESRVTDAIKMAGGFTDKADTSQINQAAFLTDGEQIYVPEIDGTTTARAAGTSQDSLSGKVNINTASSEELQTLDGIGPATAEKIIKYRTDTGRFNRIDDIKNVDGIGEKTFDSLKTYIRV